MDKKDILDKIIDYAETFAAEYGWTYEYSASIPQDIVIKLMNKMMIRKKREYQILAKIVAIGVNCGFSGKMKALDRLFNDEVEKVSDDDYLNGIRELWAKMGKNPKEIEEKIKSGNITF